MSPDDLYVGREQTQVKHFILREYLRRFAHIIGFHWDTITYVDCFSGPWNARSEEFRDSSFAIALDELREARATHSARGKPLNLRCMFLEKDPPAYAKLKEFADKVTDAKVETRNAELAEVIDDLLTFIRQGGKGSFPFIFIDPTGWTGFAMELITPLLQRKPGEVLINFMTDYIRRFIDHPQELTRQQFEALFGSGDVKDRIQELPDPQDREDLLFQMYAENVKKTGSFSHTCAAIVLYPDVERSYFHLIYATRNRKGVEVFKEVEKRAMKVMEQTRAGAKQRKRVKKTGQPELFPAESMSPAGRTDKLRDRYLGQAKDKIFQLLQTKVRVPYEGAWELALSSPLVWESDLKEWIQDWRNQDLLTIEGMKLRQRVPKLDEKNTLVWQGPISHGSG